MTIEIKFAGGSSLSFDDCMYKLSGDWIVIKTNHPDGKKTIIFSSKEIRTIEITEEPYSVYFFNTLEKAIFT